MVYHHYIDECWCGALVIVVRDKLTNKLMLICDDCELMWLNPQSFYNGEPPIPDDTKVDLDFDVSDEEIIEAGWDKYVKNMGSPP